MKLNNENNNMYDMVIYYIYFLANIFWVLLNIFHVFLDELDILYFHQIGLVIAWVISIVAVIALRRVRYWVSALLLIASFYLYAGLAIAQFPDETTHWLFLLPGILITAILLSRYAILGAWAISTIIMLASVVSAFGTNPPALFTALGTIMPYLLMYSFLSAMLYIKIADDNALLRWALDTQDKSVRRADAFFRQREELAQALRREEYQRRHLSMLNAELDEAKRTAETAHNIKMRLLANVNHDLRTPLNIILSYSQMALSAETQYGTPLPEALKQDMQQLSETAEYLVALVNDLLDLAEFETQEISIQPRHIDLKVVLTELFNVSQNAFSAADGVEWRLNLPASLPPIHADPLRLRQMIYNLLTNAMKFTAEGMIELGVQLQGDTVRIYVEDTGVGIAPDLQEQIFRPFFQHQQQFSRGTYGVGLGLHIVRKLATMHGGQVFVQSVPGAGSRFEIELPRLVSKQGAASTGVQTPVLILLAENDRITDDVQRLSIQHELSVYPLLPDADINTVLQQVHPHGIILDAVHISADTWNRLQTLRAHRAFATLPIYVAQQTGQTSEVPEQLIRNTRGEQTSEMNLPSILVVEDDAKTRSVMQRLLLQAFPHYLIHAVANGEDAITSVQDRRPELIVLDLVLPQMDGLAVLRSLREHIELQATPVLILTGKQLLEKDIAQVADLCDVVLHTKGVLQPDEFVTQVRRLLEGSQRQTQPTSSLVKQAIAYLHRHYHEDVSRESLAGNLGITERYLSQIFKEEMGFTLWTYLNRLRMEKAKHLLEFTDKPIELIAHSVGFKDVKYFSRYFRSQEGITPSAYRQK